MMKILFIGCDYLRLDDCFRIFLGSSTFFTVDNFYDYGNSDRMIAKIYV